jgi:hypothetical protein
MFSTGLSKKVLPAALCLLVIAAGCREESALDAGRYHHKAGGFSIEFYQGWEIIEGDGYEYALVEAVSPWEDAEDEFAEHITVDVEEIASGTDLESYQAETLQEQAEAVPGFRLLEEGRTRVAGVPAAYVVFDFETEGYPMTAIGYALVKEGRGYLIAGLAQAHKFVLYRDVFQEMASTLRID